MVPACMGRPLHQWLLDLGIVIIIDAQPIIRTVAVAAERMRRRSFQLAVESLLLSVAVAAERMRRHSCSERAGGSFQDPRTYLPFFVLWDTEKDSVVE